MKNASIVWDEEDFDGYNVGVATGRGLLIVDIDPRNDGHITWNEIVGDNELEAGAVILRNMTTKEQISIPIESVVEKVKAEILKGV